jgi:hypothetical protein
MWHVQLRRVTYKNSFFINSDLTGADFAGGFFVGSAFNGSKWPHARNITGNHGAVFVWYLNPKGGPPKYLPAPGYIKVMTSLTGTLSFQENAARRRLDGRKEL